jgi:16S rRNA (cytosine967-C5)-methyltransferase
MISPARRISYKLLRQITSSRVFSDNALHSPAMDALDVRDRNLTTEIVYGTLRWQGTLDFLLEGATSRPWPQVDARAQVLLRMSLYQMWHMDRIPDHALVNDAVEIAKREIGEGIDRYLNGVLRHFARNRPWKRKGFLQQAPAWVRLAMPQWLWDRWSGRYGEEIAANYAMALNHPPQSAVRLDGKALESLPFDAVQSDIVPGCALRVSGSASEDGSVHYQDEGSQLIPHLFGDLNGCHIWDACAAPGGKSAVLANLCGESGQIIASDLRQERAQRVADLLNNVGNRTGCVLIADASKPAPFRGAFDAVLADVPCSGLGTLRRNPEIKWHFDPGKHFSALRQTEMMILEAVSDRVRVGGRLLYSTCSTEPEENEQLIGEFLQAHPEFRVQRPVSPAGVERFIGNDQMVRTFPMDRLWDGFFAALLVRMK